MGTSENTSSGQKNSRIDEFRDVDDVTFGNPAVSEGGSTACIFYLTSRLQALESLRPVAFRAPIARGSAFP